MDSLNEKIELVGKDKTVRIRLGLDDNDNPYFSLNDKEGKERLILSVDDEGNGSLGFRTASGQPTVSLGVSSDLGSGMMLIDCQGETYLTFRIIDGRGQIHLDTKEGVHTWPAPSAKPLPRD